MKEMDSLIKLLKNKPDKELKTLSRYCEKYRGLQMYTFEGKMKFIKLVNNTPPLYNNAFKIFEGFIFTDNLFDTVARGCILVCESILNTRKEYLYIKPNKSI